MNSIGASPKEVKSFLCCEYELDKKMLEHLYELGEVEYKDISKCATIIEGNPYIKFTMMEEKEESGENE